MPRVPRLTNDEHLHDKSDEHVYRVHHGMDPLTGEPLRGTEVNHDECGCAHCVAYVETDPEILTAAREAWKLAKENPGAPKKVSKRRAA
jgi:hypothetical protein